MTEDDGVVVRPQIFVSVFGGELEPDFFRRKNFPKAANEGSSIGF